MSIAGDLIRGHTEAVILARLMISDSYGYEINKNIMTISNGSLSLKKPRSIQLSDVSKHQDLLHHTGVTETRQDEDTMQSLRLDVKNMQGCHTNGKIRNKLWINY